MAQIDSNLTKEQVAQMEREFARKREAAARRRAAELARLSEERTLVDKKAFFGAKTFKQVGLPETVASIDELAFANSGIESLACPSGLVDIAPKAFLRCLSLESITLNEGLRTIGDEAFAGSALAALRIPASVEHIGSSITVRTRVRHDGDNATIEVDAGNPVFFMHTGMLCRRVKRCSPQASGGPAPTRS